MPRPPAGSQPHSWLLTKRLGGRREPPRSGRRLEPAATAGARRSSAPADTWPARSGAATSRAVGHDRSSTAGPKDTLFVTNVLNGTVAAGGKDVAPRHRGADRAPGQPAASPRSLSNQVIATGFAEHTDPNALVVGPTGVGLGTNGTLYVADSVGNRIAAVPHALTRRRGALTGGGVNGHEGRSAERPVGADDRARTAYILSTNGGDGNLVETTTGGHRVATRTLVAKRRRGPVRSSDRAREQGPLLRQRLGERRGLRTRCSCCTEAPLGLTRRAPVRRPVLIALPAGRDRGSATRAGLSPPVVGAWLDRPGPLTRRALHPRADALDDRKRRLVGQVAERPPRIDSGLPASLGLPDVADTRDVALVDQRVSDRTAGIIVAQAKRNLGASKSSASTSGPSPAMR